MAQPVAKPWSDGTLTGTHYTFAKKGDVLPMHDHDDATAHISVVGPDSAFEIRTPSDRIVKVSGNVVSFNAGSPHEFEALTDGAQILAIVKGAASA